MQPCGVCGDTGVDRAGYCVRCRTYRGWPNPGGPAGYAAPALPTSGLPTSGVPMSGPPMSAPPGSGGPYPGYGHGPHSGPSGYPPPGYAQPGPGYPASSPGPGARRRLLLPLVALSVALVVIVVSIIVVVASRPDGTAGPEGVTTEIASTVDPCVVGTWIETSQRSDIAIDGVGRVPFTSSGNIQRFRADGTGELDHGSGTSVTGTVDGRKWEIILTGKITFRYQTSSGNLVYSDVSTKAYETLKIDGVTQTTRPRPGASLDPEHYQCSGDTMREHTSWYTIDLRRTGASP